LSRTQELTDECFILVKAQPHRSSRYFETVCCAGIGRDGKWRRQYPVPFRNLDDWQKFSRWQWIRYRYRLPDKDRRIESQKVDPNSLQRLTKIPKSERARLVNPLIRQSFAEAESKGESLTLLRPGAFQFFWKAKTEKELETERRKHESLARQLSMIDAPATPLEPCPYKFFVKWKDQGGQSRRHESDDWESVGAFWNFRSRYGEAEALRTLKSKYEDEYIPRGLVLAFSTHKRRNVTHGAENQWLLVGLIRLDDNAQSDLFLT
jgi:hypothetical protein